MLFWTMLSFQFLSSPPDHSWDRFWVPGRGEVGRLGFLHVLGSPAPCSNALCPSGHWSSYQDLMEKLGLLTYRLFSYFVWTQILTWSHNGCLEGRTNLIPACPALGTIYHGPQLQSNVSHPGESPRCNLSYLSPLPSWGMGTQLDSFYHTGFQCHLVIIMQPLSLSPRFSFSASLYL